MSSTQTDVMEVVGRHPKMGLAWLRVQTGPHGYKILTLLDSVLPHGMKTATKVRVKWDGNIEHKNSGYWADIEVIEDVSDEEGTPGSND